MLDRYVPDHDYDRALSASAAICALRNPVDIGFELEVEIDRRLSIRMGHVFRHQHSKRFAGDPKIDLIATIPCLERNTVCVPIPFRVTRLESKVRSHV